MKNYKTLLLTAMTILALASVSICTIGFLDYIPEPQRNIVSYVVAALFWASMIVGVLVLILFSVSLRDKKKGFYKTRTAKRKARAGIISFRKAPVSIASYIVIIIGAALLIVDSFIAWLPKEAFFPILAVTVYAFIVHCVFDGENYKIYSHTKDGLSDGE